MRRPSDGLALLFAALVSLPGTGAAFERETVDEDPTTPLFWGQRDITVRPAYDTSLDEDPTLTEVAVERSLATWESAGGGCTDIRLDPGPPPGGLSTNLDQGPRDNENRIVWREEEWPADNGALALTTIVYRVSTGEILDADIDVNGVWFTWSAQERPAAADADVENTITHEVGHLLGFAHVPDPESTMFGSSDPGETKKRDLGADDIDAVCTIYPFGEPTPGKESGRLPGQVDGGCSLSVAGPSPTLPFIPLATLLLLAVRPRQNPLQNKHKAHKT